MGFGLRYGRKIALGQDISQTTSEEDTETDGVITRKKKLFLQSEPHELTLVATSIAFSSLGLS